MNRFYFVLLSLSLVLYSCNDGDILEVALEFDQVLELCGDTESDNYVVYDTKSDPNESLTLLFPSNPTNDLIFRPVDNPHTGEMTINQNTVRFNYRIYDGSPTGLICAEIPDSDVNIIEDYEATAGTVSYVSTFVDDDNDGIPSELEDLNGNGDLEDDDSDGDGVPNYKDSDDDGDNVDTIDEDPDPNGDGVLDDALDTDGDTTPDYLDEDDDGDGVITRYEDENMDLNPRNDQFPGADVARYLDDTAVDTYVVDETNPNEFTRTVIVDFEITNANLQVLNSDLIILGTYTDSFTGPN